MTPLEVSLQWSWDRRTLSYQQEKSKGQVKSRVKLRTCPWKYQHPWHASREVPVKMNAIAAPPLPSKPDQGLPRSSAWKTELNQKSPWQVRSSDAHSCVASQPGPLATLRTLAHLPAQSLCHQLAAQGASTLLGTPRCPQPLRGNTAKTTPGLTAHQTNASRSRNKKVWIKTGSALTLIKQQRCPLL